MTDEASTTTTTRQPRTSRIKWVIVALLVILACVAATYSVLSLGNLIERARGPTPADLARQEAELKWVELWSVASRASVVTGLVALGIVVLGGAVALVSWMIKEANTIRPKDGLFPLQRLPNSPRWLRWLGSDRPLRLYNPNINPTAVLEIRPDKVQYVGAEQVSASQMQAATQGQFVQAIAAEASGPKVLAGRQSKRSGSLQPPAVYERPIPDPILLPYTASHIDRLLEAQGEVFPAQVETDSTPTI
jgi:flagellar basal body-associated protein FliL